MDRRYRKPRRVGPYARVALVAGVLAGCATRNSDVGAFYAPEAAAGIEAQSSALREQHGAYDCGRDSLLDRAPAPPVGDASGLGRAIARHFPGWRLSTEREIACRFPLGDGARPEMYWPEWGSGRTWWSWPGDFDGDERTDVLTLLSNRNNPGEDLLVVLFASGRAARVASPGGWGVEVGPGKGEVLEGFDAGEAPVRLRGDGITLVYWEKAAEVWYWNGREFRSIAVGD
jgi:hypothetical protein